MTIASDLASVFAEVEMTVPVLYGASSSRGFFDRAGTVKKVGHIAIQVETDTLFLRKGAIPGLASDTQIKVGAVGGSDAINGVLHRIAEIHEMDDGEVLALSLVGGVS